MGASIWDLGAGLPATANVSTLTEKITATAGQTVVTFSNFRYQTGGIALRVFLNGQLLTWPDDYAETDSSSITLVEALIAGDEIFAIGHDLVAEGGANASNVAYTPAGTGAVATTVQAKLRESVSATMGMSAAQIADVVGRTAAVDITTALQTAIDSLAGNPGKLTLPAGKFKVTSKISITTDRLYLEGAGAHATQILFAPTANGTCLEVQKPASGTITQGGIRGISFYSDDGTYTKVAIDLIDVTDYYLDDVVIAGSVVASGASMWSGATSIGLRTNGRDSTKISKLTSFADKPLVLADNPNSTIDGDHFHFTDLYLGANGNACVTIDTGFNLTNITFDGYQAWVLGTDGLRWVDTTSSAASGILSISGLRTEQGTSATAYSINIQHNTGLQDLRLMGCKFDNSRRGVYLRKCERVTNDGVIYDSTSRVAYDATAADANAQLLFRNSFFGGGSTATLTNYQQVWALQQPTTSSPIPPNAVYQYAYTDGRRSHYEYGAKVEYFTGTLANAANIDLYCGTNAGAVAAHVDVVAYSSVGPLNLGGSAICTANTNVLIAGTANFNVGNVAGSLTVFKNGGSVILFNQSGQTVTYVVRVMWI